MPETRPQTRKGKRQGSLSLLQRERPTKSRAVVTTADASHPPAVKLKCYRIQGIPDTATREEVERELTNGDALARDSEAQDPRLTLARSSANDLTATLLSFQPPQHRQYVVDETFLGITPLFEAENATVDIIAVPGLGSHAIGGFMAKDTGNVWLRDFLPTDLRQDHPVRILSYGYETRLAEKNVKYSIRDLANAFLDSFNAFRAMTKTSRRPIIFVGHSLGGLVIKEAISTALQDKQNPQNGDFFQSSYGLIFFGVPHRGLKFGRLKELIAEQPNAQLIIDLETDKESEPTPYLRELTRKFSRNSKQHDPPFRIISYWEQRKTPTLKKSEDGRLSRGGEECFVVTQESACGIGFENEHDVTQPLDLDHSNLVKFPSRHNDYYKRVLNRLKLLINGAPDIVGDQGSTTIEMSDSDRECMMALKVTDPRHDKTRIQSEKGGLLRDSYRWVLETDEFCEWRDGENSQLLWIKGDPGKGKTMLLCGIIDELSPKTTRENGNASKVLSYFFCQAANSSLNSATAVLRGLIYLLVQQQPSLISHIHSRYGDTGNKLFTDLNSWFALSEIFDKILRDPNLRETYLVIDALDECTQGQAELLTLIARKSSASSRVKWIVSSRKWPEIEKELRKSTQKVQLSLELNEESVSAAVDKYIQYKVETLSERNGYTKITHDAVKKYLSTHAQGTFLWVALVCRQLYKISNWKVQSTLNVIEYPSGLQEFYKIMLRNLQAQNEDLFNRILATMAVLYRPISTQELTALVKLPEGLDNKDFDDIIERCGSFLTLQSDTVSFVHQSAKDFLVGVTELFPGGVEGVHDSIFSHSLQVMSKTLRRDIYNLQAPGILIDEVIQPDQDPLAAVHYSCVYWIDHLCSSTLTASHLQGGSSVDTFLCRHFLHWLEALSLIHSLSYGILSIAKLKTEFHDQTSPLAKLVRDAHRFTQFFQLAIETSPLQLYASALIFSPTESAVKQQFQTEEPKWVITNAVVDNLWSACMQTLEGHIDTVNSVAWSADGKWLASSSFDKTVKIWDPTTGQCRTTLEGHTDTVNSVAWSADGKWLASSSDDKTVKIWDPTTGQCRTTLEGHTDNVNSVAWSADGKWLASSSFDKTVKIWDPTTGQCRTTLEGHTRNVDPIAWSTDGILASSSWDDTVKIWDPTTGQCRTTLKIGFTRNLQFKTPNHLETDIGVFEWNSVVAVIDSEDDSLSNSTSLPPSTGYGLNEEGTWILYEGRNLLWLPPEYRPRSSSTFCSTLAIGCRSNDVLILKFAEFTASPSLLLL